MTNPINDITADEVKALLSYDPETGELRCKVARGKLRVGDLAGTKKYRGYLAICVNRRLYYAHRLAFLVMTGRWPASQIDHRDGNCGNNRWLNLRESSASGNLKNQLESSRNTSGCRGVTFDTQRGLWCARITSNGKTKHIGRFASFDAAVAARKEAEIVYFGEFRRARP